MTATPSDPYDSAERFVAAGKELELGARSSSKDFSGTEKGLPQITVAITGMPIVERTGRTFVVLQRTNIKGMFGDIPFASQVAVAWNAEKHQWECVSAARVRVYGPELIAECKMRYL